MIVIDPQGLRGKKVSLASIPWKSISAFSVENSGTFDLDAELKVCGSGFGVCELEFSKGTDMNAINELLNNQIFGFGDPLPPTTRAKTPSKTASHSGGKVKFRRAWEPTLSRISPDRTLPQTLQVTRRLDQYLEAQRHVSRSLRLVDVSQPSSQRDMERREPRPGRFVCCRPSGSLRSVPEGTAPFASPERSVSLR